MTLDEVSDGYYYQEEVDESQYFEGWLEHICLVQDHVITDGWLNKDGTWGKEKADKINLWELPGTAKKIPYKKVVALML